MSDKHVLVTFLGAPDRSRPPTRWPHPHYQEVIYDFRGCKPPSVPGLYQERFFPFALREHLEKTGDAIQAMVIFGTPGSAWDEFLLNVGIPGLLARDLEDLRRQASRNEVQEKDLEATWAERVRKALRLGTVQLKVIDYAKVLDDQVAIIATLNEATKSATTISIDVTHGLRYMPLLGSLAAYVVETTRGSPTLSTTGSAAKVKGVWYGALDLKKPDCIGQEIAPAIDVGGLSRIVDWLAAFKNFDWDGDYSAFIEVIEQDGVAEETAEILEHAAYLETLGHFDGASEKLRCFVDRIKNQDVPRMTSLFRDAMITHLERFLKEPLYTRQRRMVEEALRRGDVPRAVIWAREAAITRIALQMCRRNPDNNANKNIAKKSDRDDLEKQYKNAYKSGDYAEESPQKKHRENMERLKQIRNCFAHVYTSEMAPTIQNTVDNKKQCKERLILKWTPIWGPAA